MSQSCRPWAVDHTQRQVLAMVEEDHAVHWSSTSLRRVLVSLSAGMAPHRYVAQVKHVVQWLGQARASTGRYRPTLSVGRDGIFVPLQHKIWQEGATETVSAILGIAISTRHCSEDGPRHSA
jgi:hypothetical protein